VNFPRGGYYCLEIISTSKSLKAIKKKHADITDELILELLKLFVDKKTFQPDKLTTDYFVLEKILHLGKKYKLV